MKSLVLYVITLFALVIYSFVLIDPNLTFLPTAMWASFRDWAVQIGYYQREMSWYIYFGFITLLFIFHWYFTHRETKLKPPIIALVVGSILLLSYPLLSHDFFNYMFDAKILTFYHKNPYLFMALDFPSDPWIRFMHWVHRAYPYGPVFLAVSLVPAAMGLGKFILHFYFLKAFVVGAYALSVYFLYKLNKRHAMFFATHPLVLIEGLVAGHNDIFAVMFGIIGLYYLEQKHHILGTTLMFLSAGVKYITLPYIMLTKHGVWAKYRNILAFLGLAALLSYFTFFQVIQPWYFLNLFVFLPVFKNVVERMQLFFFGLLMSYYPYIRLGGWDTDDKVILKENIILVFAVLNVVYFLFTLFQQRRAEHSLTGEHGSSKEHTSSRT